MERRNTRIPSAETTGEDDQAKRKEAQRKAFKRALNQLGRKFPTWVTSEGAEWIWAVASPDTPDTADIPDMS